MNTDTPVDPKAPKEVNLPSGVKAIINPFKGKDIRKAQAIAGDDSSKILFAIIALTIAIDGKGVTAEEIDEMDGMDVLELMKAFGTNFTPRQNS